MFFDDIIPQLPAAGPGTALSLRWAISEKKSNSNPEAKITRSAAFHVQKAGVCWKRRQQVGRDQEMTRDYPDGTSQETCSFYWILAASLKFL